MLFPALAENPAQVSRFLGVLTGTVAIRDFFGPANLRGIVGSRTLLRMMAARAAPVTNLRGRPGAPR